MMKKIIVSFLILMQIVLLVSCKKGGSGLSLDDNSKYTEFYSSYIFNKETNTDRVSFSETALNTTDVTKEDGYDAKKTAHFEVYMPTDVTTCFMLNVMSVSNYGNRSTAYANYASTSNLNATQYSQIIDILALDTQVSTQTFVTGLKVFENYSTKLETPEGFIAADKDTKYLAVVYVPTLVKYVTYDSDGARFITLWTYVLVPCYATLTLKSNNVFNDTLVQGLNTDTNLVSFTVRNGAII